MNFKRCMYYVEGSCEEKLINALKIEPRILVPGKVKVHNVILEELPRREVNMIQAGTMVVFVFDTDVEKTDILKRNIDHVKKYALQAKIVNLAQVMNFEDEIVRATDVKKAQDITKSSSLKGFKNDFCKMKLEDCRNALERHHLDVSKLWITKTPSAFEFVQQGSAAVKI
jgi:hypothetical protein